MKYQGSHNLDPDVQWNPVVFPFKLKHLSLAQIRALSPSLLNSLLSSLQDQSLLELGHWVLDIAHKGDYLSILIHHAPKFKGLWVNPPRQYPHLHPLFQSCTGLKRLVTGVQQFQGTFDWISIPVPLDTLVLLCSFDRYIIGRIIQEVLATFDRNPVSLSKLRKLEVWVSVKCKETRGQQELEEMCRARSIILTICRYK